MPATASAVEREIRIDAAPETIFEFLVEPDKMPLWMGRKAELEPRAGGVYRVDINGEYIANGEFVEVDPPRRVVFTWGWEGDGTAVPPGTSTVEITLAPEGDSTLVRLVHTDLPEAEREPHRHGWDLYMERLALIAVGEDPGPDPNANRQR
ncbi:MAG TPA: SRPBCC domain-containing protein [Thermoleophilaceae bacterium]|jgi:uncharacterized protein YndB with AHSA1/START domain